MVEHGIHLKREPTHRRVVGTNTLCCLLYLWLLVFVGNYKFQTAAWSPKKQTHHKKTMKNKKIHTIVANITTTLYFHHSSSFSKTTRPSEIYSFRQTIKTTTTNNVFSKKQRILKNLRGA